MANMEAEKDKKNPFKKFIKQKVMMNYFVVKKKKKNGEGDLVNKDTDGNPSEVVNKDTDGSPSEVVTSPSVVDLCAADSTCAGVYNSVRGPKRKEVRMYTLFVNKLDSQPF